VVQDGVPDEVRHEVPINAVAVEDPEQVQVRVAAEHVLRKVPVSERSEHKGS
jgi:hypothetical protein